MTTQGAGFCKAERTGKNGNIISPKGSNNTGGSQVAELSSHEDLEEAQLSEDELVVELEEGGKIRELDEEERFIKVKTDSLSSDRLEKFFTDEEIAELQEKEETVTGEEKETTYEEAMEGMRRDIEKFNEAVRERKKQEEIDRLKEFRKKGTKYDPDRSVSDLSGEEFREILQEANQEGSGETVDEELQEEIAKIEEKWSKSEPDTEISNPDSKVEELATNSFEEYGNSAFQDIAEDLAKSDEETMYESVGPNSKRVTTQDSELKQALRNPEDEPNWTGSVELVEDSGSTVIAVVREE